MIHAFRREILLMIHTPKRQQCLKGILNDLIWEVSLSWTAEGAHRVFAVTEGRTWTNHSTCVELYWVPNRSPFFGYHFVNSYRGFLLNHTFIVLSITFIYVQFLVKVRPKLSDSGNIDEERHRCTQIPVFVCLSVCLMCMDFEWNINSVLLCYPIIII